MNQRWLWSSLLLLTIAGILKAETENVPDPHALYQNAAAQLKDHPETAQAGFHQAAAAFEQLVKSGNANSRLLYNAGCANLMAGNAGRATFYLRQSQRLQPGDVNTQAALTKVRQSLGSETAALISVREWWRLPIPPVVQLGTGLAASLLGWLLFGLAWRSKRSTALAGSLALVLLGSSVAGIVVWDLYRDQATPWGVVVAYAPLHEGNSTTFRPVLNRALPPGVEFRTLNQKEGWLQVELANGMRGWLQAHEVLIAR